MNTKLQNWGKAFKIPQIKNNIKNEDIANFLLESENFSTDGVFDFDNDGTNDGNITYIKDENNNIIGANIFSLDGEKTAEIDLEFDNDKITKIAIDNDFDNIEDYTHYLEYETSKHNQEESILSYERIEKKNKNKTIITEKEYSVSWFYNENRKRTETTSTYNSDGEITRKSESQYDAKGNERYSETERYKNNELTDKESTEYNKNGNIEYSKVEEYENGVLVNGEETFYTGDEEFTYPVNNNANNGQVDYTAQKEIGDCWLLASINALNSVDPQIVSDMISYTNDGAIINFAFSSYEITDEELQSEKAKRQYSTGDDDMIRIEIAMEKYLEDYVNGKIDLPTEDYIINNFRAFNKHGEEEAGETLIDGGWEAQAFYLMTGKEVSITQNLNINNNRMINNLSEKIEEGEIAATTSFKEETDITDIHGNTITLHDHHAYTIKSMDESTVVIVNPWNAAEDIEIPTDTFLENYRDITTCNINGKENSIKKFANWGHEIEQKAKEGWEKVEDFGHEIENKVEEGWEKVEDFGHEIENKVEEGWNDFWSLF